LGALTGFNFVRLDEKKHRLPLSVHFSSRALMTFRDPDSDEIFSSAWIKPEDAIASWIGDTIL
jgi:hypothetical protein